MTITDEPPIDVGDEPERETEVPEVATPTVEELEAQLAASSEEEVEGPPPVSELLRPVLAAALAAGAAGLVAGGIFGSWGARATGLVGALFGALWVLLALRSPRPGFIVLTFPVVALIGMAFSLVVRGANPGEMATLIGDAISAGRLFRPPVPYDPGWTPTLLLVMACLGFACAWIATALERSKLAVAIPIPLVLLLAITQPDDQQFLGGLLAFLPILGALAVLFGGHADRTRDLGSEFELKRALKAGAVAVPLIALLIGLNSASFLFPDPVYDPNDQPQKPKAVPLSEAHDRVLFEVQTDSGITGPWRSGVLDVYDEEDGFWKTSPRDLQPFPAGGRVSPIRAGNTQLEITVVTRDLGNSPVYPSVGGTTEVRFVNGVPGGLRFDPRTELMRMNSGRVPMNTTYVLSLPNYATDQQLARAKVPKSSEFDEFLEIPKPPAVVRDILNLAPPTPWGRLDALRQKLLSNITAKGAGTPDAITAQRVGDMFEKGAKASPYEIVAAEAMLARWAGVPARIGFGFDGLNKEKKVFTVRPKNSAQWLEVNFDGYGWLPLVGAPKQAEADLENDPNTRFNPTIQASDDVAVEIYLPFEIKDAKLLYQRLREYLARYLPLLVLGVIAFFTFPFFSKWYRRGKRRRWAAALGPRHQIAVEYAELRDLASDLNVADIYSTPLEYVFEVIDDREHAEFAWLVARSLYGDMRRTVGEADALAAEQLSTSLRRRLLRGQPVPSQIAALFSRASIKQPYTTEVPNIRLMAMPTLPRPSLAGVRASARRRRRAATGRRRLIRRTV